MNTPPIYFEVLSFWTLMSSFYNNAVFRHELIFKNKNPIFYINATNFGQKIIAPFFRLIGFSVTRLDFKMKDVKDENGELLRLRIARADLFEIQKQVLDSLTYKTLYHVSWEQDHILDFLKKGFIDEGIMDKKSVSYIIFILNVISWHMKKMNVTDALFIINQRPWLDIYKKYSLQYRISLLNAKVSPLDKFSKAEIKKFLKSYPRLFGILKSFKYREKVANSNNTLPKLFLDGRGDVNLKNNGHHSDFFWLFNSEFPERNLLYQYVSEKERKELDEYGINVTSGSVKRDGLPRKYSKPQLTKQNGFSQESNLIKSMLASYVSTRDYWRSFFYANETKVYMMWHRFNNYHMAVTDAINDVGGISVYWPVSFDGYIAAECVSNTDVVFSYSHFTAGLDIKMGAKFKYNVITGYPKDYAGQMLKEEARVLRKKLQDNGAKKIVFVIDENSIDDDRWHTGHELQRENYSYILEKMLVTPWLGVVFKPKAAKSLRQRLGTVATLLAQAENTGRCYIYEESGRYTTSAPPLLAGLSADVCIHGHLCSGTAALECALEDLPTLLIDREGMPESKLYELPEGTVIFKSWPEAIDAVMEHFNRPEGIPGFGDWSSIINDLDPFRDGMAAKRMGDYLHWLIQGYEQGLDKESIMENAAEKYRKQWGVDKVLTI